MQVQPVTKYEKTRILGLRAMQLSSGSKPMTNIGNLRDPLKIAEKEYNEGTIPISVIRAFPNGQKIQINIVPRTKPAFILDNDNEEI